MDSDPSDRPGDRVTSGQRISHTCHVLTKWVTPTQKNRLRVSVLLATGGMLTGGWATMNTGPSVTGVLGVLLAWITGAMAVLTGWLWLASYGDRWRLPFATTGVLLAGATLATIVMLEPPKILLLTPFYALATWLAVHIERNRIGAWRVDQRGKQERTFSAEHLREDPLISERDHTRMEDAKAKYPSSLREVRARIKRTEGDPWA